MIGTGIIKINAIREDKGRMVHAPGGTKFEKLERFQITSIEN